MQAENSENPFGAENRQPYQKPVLERIRLAPDEVVLGACKVPGHGCPIPPDPGSLKPGS